MSRKCNFFLVDRTSFYVFSVEFVGKYFLTHIQNAFANFVICFVQGIIT
jgi:hypothetical protein